MFSCCFIAFDVLSREHLGHFSGHFSVVTFSRSNLGTFFEACGHFFSRSNFGTFSRGLRLHFLGNSRSTNSSFEPPPNMILASARIRRTTENGSLEAFLADLCLATVTSCSKKIVACKFRRCEHHTHVLVTTRKGSWQTR